jgi:sigma-E factor negative regulatory protein RseA
MTQEISSLMDGELDPHASEQSIQACCRSAELKQAWQAYHVIGETLRGDSYRRIDVAAAVMAAIEQEPAIIARPRRAQSFARIALAAAASVATIGVVGWIGTQGMPGAQSPALATAPATAPVLTVAAGDASAPTAQPALGKANYPTIEVQDYLAAHRQMPSPDLYRNVAARTPAKAP